MKTVILTTAGSLRIVASPSFAARTEAGVPLPGCDTRNTDRAQWRRAVQTMTEDAARYGGATGGTQLRGPMRTSAAARAKCDRQMAADGQP